MADKFFIMAKITGTGSVSDFYDEEKGRQTTKKEKQKPTNRKVQGVVLSKIPQTLPSNLLAAATSPHLVMDLISDMALPTLEEGEWIGSQATEKKDSIKKEKGKTIPIGLRTCPEMSLLNSLMQLILFIPGFRELFAFVPRSFQPLANFLEQYQIDQATGCSISKASPQSLLRCLRAKLPAHLFRFPTKIDIPEFLLSLTKAAFPQLGTLLNHSDSIALHSDWYMYWDVSLPFCYVANQHLSREGKRLLRPAEFLVALKNKSEKTICQLVKRQYFTPHDQQCYDLDGFIEYRPDGGALGHYIAYLKIDGIWYQCDDERIITLRSTNLNVPLHRSILLHYKKVNLRHSAWCSFQ